VPLTYALPTTTTTPTLERRPLDDLAALALLGDLRAFHQVFLVARAPGAGPPERR
jgi:hypothetical protein